MTDTAPTEAHTQKLRKQTLHTMVSVSLNECAPTSGKGPSHERDMAALETQPVSEEVSQLVVAGEVDDGCRNSHDSANRRKKELELK